MDTQNEKDKESILEADSDQIGLMLWHLRIVRLSFNKLRDIAALGIISKSSPKFKIPKFSY